MVIAATIIWLNFIAIQIGIDHYNDEQQQKNNTEQIINTPDTTEAQN